MTLIPPNGELVYEIRPLTADQTLLREMLYLSLYVREGEPLFEREILHRPEIARYIVRAIRVRYRHDDGLSITMVKQLT